MQEQPPQANLVIPFDFTAYLDRILRSSREWEVETLHGGAANYIVRARPMKGTNSHNDASKDTHQNAPNSYMFTPDSNSIIIKQAPPFLAKSPEIAFSPYRQTIEAKALQVFHPSNTGNTPNGLANVLSRNSGIRIPELLCHDVSDNVLIQSDLGSLPNLHEILISPTTTDVTAREIGSMIGRFLADMHDPAACPPEYTEMFSNLVGESTMEACIEQVRQFMLAAGISDHNSLADTALNHWRTREKTVFGQGDIWFGTLLVDNHTQDDNDTLLTIGICDWEWAGPNDPAADIAQLGCYVHLLSICALTSPTQNEIVTAFADALYGAYFAGLTKLPDLAFWRSLLIMHGWEMINAAGWSARQSLWCTCKGSGVRCAHIKALVVEGSRFLRAAERASSTSEATLAMADLPWAKYFPIAAPGPS